MTRPKVNKANTNSDDDDSLVLSAKKIELIIQNAVLEVTDKLQNEIKLLSLKLSDLQHLIKTSVCQKCLDPEVQLEDDVKANVDEDDEANEFKNSDEDTVINVTPKKRQAGTKKARPQLKQQHNLKQVISTEISYTNRNNKSKRILIHGTAAPTTESSNFSAATRRAWLYVGRARSDTTCEQIESFLKNKYSGREFIIEALPRRDNSYSASFKLGADATLMDDLYKSENWPTGILVKKFDFFRRKPSNFPTK